MGYIEREGRALIATEKGVQVISLLGEHPLTSAELTGSWEQRLSLIEQGEDTRPAFMSDIVKFTTDTVQELDKLKGVKIERANLGPCPVCGRDVIENRKGYSLVEDYPGAALSSGEEATRSSPSRRKERCERRTDKAVPASASGRTSLQAQARAGRGRREVRVEFDEEWGPHARSERESKWRS